MVTIRGGCGPIVSMILLAGLSAAMPACRKEKPSDVESAPAGEKPWFENVVSSSGVTFVHSTGEAGDFLYPEIASAGVCACDFDNDGYLDLYFVESGKIDPAQRTSGNRLFRNKGNFAFVDVTAQAGVGDTGYGSGCACADYDADGDVDLYVTNLGPNVLYRNNGDGTFTDITEIAGVGDKSWGSSCAFVDYDADGMLDLFVVNNLHWSRGVERDCLTPGGKRDYCGPKTYASPSRDVLYRNVGNGRFEDVTAASGVHRSLGNGFGVAVADYNSDGRTDIYVANDEMPNHLWINMGNGRFEDEALLAGCAVNIQGMAEAGMGVAAVDIENDGDFDLFMSHLDVETNTFYLNSGGMFEDVTTGTGLGAASVGFTGFGLGFADFDHDGELDVFVANGGVRDPKTIYDPKNPYAEPDQLFRGIGGGRFEEVMPRGGAGEPLLGRGRGTAFADLDNDGDIDIVVSNNNGRPHLLRNLAGERGRWIMFRVLDRRGIDALGTTLRIDDGTRVQWRIAEISYGYCGSNDPRVHVGLGKSAGVKQVMVRWPDGSKETFGPFPAGAVHELRQGAGRGR